MRTQSSFLKLTPVQKDALLGMVLTLVVAFFYYAQWAIYLTGVPDSKISIENPGRYFWWADDSREYRLTADWMFGRPGEIFDWIAGQTVTTYIDIRPWLYPFFVGLARLTLGPLAETVLWLGQAAMWMATISLLYCAIYNVTRRVVIAMIAAAVFFLHPSPLAHTFHGMTETLNILLLAILCWVLTSQLRNKLLLSVLILSFLTVTKPTYQIQLGLALLLVVWRIFRSTPALRLRQIALTALMLLPVLVQLGFSFGYNRTLSISEIGPTTFKYFFVAVVHAHEEDIQWRESLKIVQPWDLREQLGYLFTHGRATLYTLRHNLIDTNLWTGSFFIRGDGNRMIPFVEHVNGLAALLHIFMLPVMMYYLLSAGYQKDKINLIALYAIFLIQTLVTAISTGQDDRLIVTGIPLWIVCYVLTLYRLAEAPSPFFRESS
jgi:hypothetical protein